MTLPPVCILAGGLGTRLGALVADTPKPLLEVAGRPFLLHQLEQLARNGAERVVLCVGYRGQQIEQRIGTEQFGIAIDYRYDGPTLAGTLGAIRGALPLLDDEFLVLYGDSYLTLDYARAVAVWRASGFPALMTVLRNDDRWDRSNAVYDGQRVVTYDKLLKTEDMCWIDYGLGGLRANVVTNAPPGITDLSALQHLLAKRGELCGFEVHDRFYEIGSPAGLRQAERFLSRRHRSRTQ